LERALVRHYNPRLPQSGCSEIGLIERIERRGPEAALGYIVPKYLNRVNPLEWG
jgi:hypothetical protein